MIIKVGTNNAIKVEAVKEALADYPLLAEAEVLGINVSSGVSEQPRCTHDTFRGAFNRAVEAYKSGADLGIGIESGITSVPLGWVNFTVAIVCDNDPPEWDPDYRWCCASAKEIHYGQSTGFPIPPRIVDCILNKGMDMDQAAYACDIVDVPNIGKVEGGFLGVLTKGRISRKTYSKQALQMALISWENKEMFASDEDKS